MLRSSVSLLSAFVVALGTTLGVTAAVDAGGDDGSSGSVAGAPLAVIGPADGVLGPEPAPTTDAEPASSGGSGSGGGSGPASRDPSDPVSVLQPLVSEGEDEVAGVRFVDPCADPDGEGGCEGTTASIIGASEEVPFALQAEADRCFAGDPALTGTADFPGLALVPDDPVRSGGVGLLITSTAPATFGVTAGLEPGAADVVAVGATSPEVVEHWYSVLADGVRPHVVVTCVALDLPDRTGLWYIEVAGEEIDTGVTASFELRYDAVADRPRPPVVVQTPSSAFGSQEVTVTVPQFDHPTDPLFQSRQGAAAIYDFGGGHEEQCAPTEAGVFDEPAVRHAGRTFSDTFGDGPRLTPGRDDPAAPYDPGWDRFVTYHFPGGRFEARHHYAICVRWLNEASHLLESEIITLASPNRFAYEIDVTKVRFREPTPLGSLTVVPFLECTITFTGGRPIREVTGDDLGQTCTHDGVGSPPNSLLDVATGGPVVPVQIRVPQGDVTRFVHLPGSPCAPGARAGDCGPLRSLGFTEKYVLPMVSSDREGVCQPGLAGRGCDARYAGKVTLRVRFHSTSSPPTAADWIVGFRNLYE